MDLGPRGLRILPRELLLWHSGLGCSLGAPGCRFHPWPGAVDPVLLPLVSRLRLRSDPWPGSSICHGVANKQQQQQNPTREFLLWCNGIHGDLGVLGHRFNPALPCLWHRWLLRLRSDQRPGNSICLVGQERKKEEKKELG